MKRVLNITDVQNDFVPGGALPVPHGHEIVPIINRLMPFFDLVVATQDWHPADHQSFAIQHPGKKPGDEVSVMGVTQVLWPVHCVQNTWGAEFVKELDQTRISHVVRKGTNRMIDSYSGFFDNKRLKETELAAYLRKHVGSDCAFYMTGLATDYCVKYTALDALSLGFKTFIIEDCCYGIDLHPGDVRKALDEMVAAGATIVHSTDILNPS